jgi:hypothetical protein
MTENCTGVKAYKCPYGDFCKADRYKQLYLSYDPKSREEITNFINKFTDESPLWTRDNIIYACEPKLEEKDLNQLLNEIYVLM